jgi:hypothetical protein
VKVHKSLWGCIKVCVEEEEEEETEEETKIPVNG